MDTKQMLKDGFKKVQVAVVLDRNTHTGKSKITVVDTIENAKRYRNSGELRLATMYIKENLYESK